MEGFSYNKRSVLEKYDSTPTANSTNLVPSGGIKTYVDSADAIIDAKVDDMISRVGNPFVFKGTVAALTDLPVSGNTVNDTYFVTAEGFMYTWNGTSWDKTSTDVNNQLAHDIATEYDATKADYKAGNIVMYNNQVYVRNADATAAEGTFVAANWTATSIGDEFSSEITNLRNAVTMKDIETSLDMAWEVGSIKNDTGANQTSSKRIRSGSGLYFTFDEITRIRVNSGYKLLIFVYTTNAYSSFIGMYDGDTVGSDTTWLTSDIFINSDLEMKYFRLVLGAEDDSTVGVSAGENVSFWSNTDVTLTRYGSPANAKYTGDAITDAKSAIPSQTENPCFFKARVQTDGTITLSDDRYLLSIPFYNPKEYFKASCKSGYTYEALVYSKSGDTYTYVGVYDRSKPTKISQSACWIDGEEFISLPDNYYYRIMGKLVSENSITEEDGNYFYIHSNAGTFINETGEVDYPLGSKAIFDNLSSYIFTKIDYLSIDFTNDNSLIDTYSNIVRGVGTDSDYHGITPYLKMNYEFTVNLPSGYKFKWYEYSEATYTTYTKRFASSWLDSGTTVKCNPCYYKIAVCKTNGSLVDFTEIKNEVSIITYNYKYSFDTTLWNYGAWTHGSIYTSDGTSNGTAEKYPNRCRTPLLAVRDMDIFSFDTTIVVTAYYYSSNSTSSYLGSVKHERINNPFSIATDLTQYPTATYIRFCVYYQDDRNIANVEECIRSIKINIDPRYAVFHDTPDSQGTENMVNRAYDLTNIRYTVTNNLPAQETSSFPNNYIPTGTLCIGVKYSSTRNEQLYVPQAVSLKSYASAILNPNSYIYTRISEVLPGFSPNSLTYYGAVCSTFVAYAYGIDDVIPTTLSFSTYPGFHRLPDYMQNPCSLKIGYMLNHRGSHISLVTDIIRDSSGKVLYIQLSEAWHPFMEKNYRTPEWVKTERFEAGFEAYWYDNIDAIPAADNSTWMNIDSSLYTSGALNSNLAPRRGEDANWRFGETIEIDVIDQGSYTSYVLVNRSTNSVISTTSLSGSLISLPGLNAGEYKLYLSNGSTNSKAVNFNIVSTTETYSVSGNNVTVTYQSSTGTPSAIIFANNNTAPGSRSDYKAVRAFHVLSASEISAGTCTISKPEESDLEFEDEEYEAPNGVWKMRVMYKTDFGLYSSDFADVQF